MKSLRSRFENNFLRENVTIHFYSMRGNLKTLRLNQILLFTAGVLALCILLCAGMVYSNMHREYTLMKSTYSESVDRCKSLENKNAELIAQIEKIEKDLQKTQDDMNEMVRYKSTLEKSSFIQSILK